MTGPDHRGNSRSRIFELLLGFAGRIDDDALTECRELLAVVEADRALALLLGCLVATGEPVTEGERDELGELARELLGDGAAADAPVTGPDATAMRHRFTASGAADPGAGVLDAVRGTLDVLPDVRALRCAWRGTPAGRSPGPVPHRVVLVELAPGGYPAAVGYRLELALRRAGIRAGVEVLTGTGVPAYHRAALDVARELPIGRAAAEAPAPVAQDPPRSFEDWSADGRAPAERPAEQATGGRRHAAAAAPASAQAPAAGREVRRARRAPEAPAEPPARQPAPAPAPAQASPQVTGPAQESWNHGVSFFPPEVAAEVDTTGAPAPAPAAGEAEQELNDQERDLLRRLHEELGRREREPAAGPEGGNGHRLPDAQTAVWPAPGWGEISSRL